MQQLTINPELKSLIPPLTAEEFKQLETNVLAEGIREPIITWNGTIVDGHNRYELAEMYELPFKTLEMEFESFSHCKKWMAENQLGRRNLTDFVKGELMRIIRDCLREIGGVKYAETVGRPSKESLSILDNDLPKHNTRQIVADKLGWSETKLARFDVVDKKAPEEVKEKLRTGEVSINQVYQEIKKQEKEQEKTQKAEQIKAQEFEPIENVFNGSCLEHIKTLDDKSIDCVVTDPPYGVDFQMNAYNNELSRKIENDKSLEDALKLLSEVLAEIKPKMKEDGQLYIFCSWQIYPAFAEVVAKHFEIHNLLIWNKMIMGMGDLKSNYGGMYEMIIFAGAKRNFKTRPANIINCRFNDERFHNTQKPVDLIKTILEISTRENEFVYDPFLGSGSTAVAAKQLNLSYGGSEIDYQNYKITLKRLSDVKL